MSKTVVISATLPFLTLGLIGYLLVSGRPGAKAETAPAAHEVAASEGEHLDGGAKKEHPAKGPVPAAAAAHGAEGHAVVPAVGGHEPKAKEAAALKPGEAAPATHGEAAVAPAEAKAAAGEVALAALAAAHSEVVAEHGAAVAAPAGAHGEEAGPDPTDVAGQLLEGNLRFVAGIPSAHSWNSERAQVTASQHPKAMVLSCSDSRVPPEHVFDQGLGDLFVVRTAGNVADLVAVGSLEYAAEHLGPRLLVVLGHERCGAVTAAASGKKVPSKNLDAVIRRISPSVLATAGWAKGPAHIRLAAEMNVGHTADDLLKLSPVLRKLEAEGKIKILRAMYDLDTGRVRPLP
jgi:carbonic anhydrase